MTSTADHSEQRSVDTAAEEATATGEAPALLADPPSPEEAAEARRYSRATLRCVLLDMAVDTCVLAVMAIALGPMLDGWLAHWSWLAGEHNLWRVAALSIVMTAIHASVSLPLSFYADFVLERRFGLSKQSARRWVLNWLKKTALTVALLATLYTGLFAIIWSVGTWWWLVAAGAFFIVSAVLGQLAPVVILPLFYKVEPIESQEDTDRLRALARDTGIEIEGVFRLGMSAETSKANAMLAGLGATRRVLLGDTLLESFSPAEIDTVFAHELGHHVHRHLPKLLTLVGVTAMAGLFACHLALGAWTGVTDPAAWPVAVLPKAVFLLTLFSLLSGPLQNLVSRHFERQADRYAVKRTANHAAFRSAFLKLARMNKADLDPHPLEVWLLHSHPPIGERLKLIERLS